MADRRLAASATGMVLIVVLSVATLGVGAFAAGDGGAVSQETPTEEATPIDSCTVIDEPGTYELADDIENASRDTCIEIRAPNVVLDGNGNEIDGLLNQSEAQAFLDAIFENGTSPVDPRWATHGVAVRGNAGAENVTVRDVRVNNWFYGVVVLNSTGGTVENVTGTLNGEAIDIYSSTGVSVSDANATRNVDGIIFDTSTASQLVDSRAAENTLDGIGLYNATEVEVRSVESRDNGLDGVYLQDSANVAVRNGEFVNNSEAGVFLGNVTGSTLRANTITDTRGTVSFPPIDSGALILANSSENSIRNTRVQNNSNWTYFAAEGSTNNRVIGLSLPNATFSFTSGDVAITETGLLNATVANGTAENGTDAGPVGNETDGTASPGGDETTATDGEATPTTEGQPALDAPEVRS